MEQALFATLLLFSGAEATYGFGTYYRPFLAQSLWNSRPLNPTFDATAAVGLSDIGWFPEITSGAYSTGVYLPLSTDPPVTVYPLSGQTGVWNVDAFEYLANITIPRWPADTLAAVGTDGHCEIIDNATNIIHSFWQLKKDGNVWRARQYAWSPLNGYGFGDPAHYYQGARAAGVPSSAGIIRKHETADGAAYFSHALTMSLANKSLAGNPAYIYPATSADSNAATTDIGLIPEGALLMLPSSFNTSTISSLNLRKVAETLKMYGAYVVDRNTQTPFDIYVENGANFSLSNVSGWDNTVENDLQRIRAALKMLKSAEGWIDGNGNPLNLQTYVNILSMRGPSSWYRISGDANVRFDTWTQSLVYDGNNAQNTSHQNEGGLGYNAVSWGKLRDNKPYRFTVTATQGIKLQLIVRTQANVQIATSGLLGDGEAWNFNYTPGSKLVLLAVKPAGGSGHVRGNLVYNYVATIPYRGNNTQLP